MAEYKEFQQSAKRAIEQQGSKVMMHTDECIAWKASHESCEGCPYELPCSQYIGLLATGMDTNPTGKVVTILNVKDPSTIANIDFNFDLIPSEEE